MPISDTTLTSERSRLIEDRIRAARRLDLSRRDLFWVGKSACDSAEGWASHREVQAASALLLHLASEIDRLDQDIAHAEALIAARQH